MKEDGDKDDVLDATSKLKLYSSSHQTFSSSLSNYFLFRPDFDEYEEDISSGLEFTSSKLKEGIIPGDYAPIFQLPMKSNIVVEGMTTKISACVRAKPEPTIKWYKNGTELLPGGTKYRMTNIGGLCSLILLNINFSYIILNLISFRCSDTGYL